MTSFFYLTRISWNETDPKTGESYKTFISGGTYVGMPAFIYARTPFASYGSTAINPDVMDLFVEDVKQVDGREMYYDAKDKTYKDYEVREETIKVRFGSDVTLKIKHTANGFVVPNDIMEDVAGTVIPWIAREVMPSEKDQEEGKVYVVGNAFDPVM